MSIKSYLQSYQNGNYYQYYLGIDESAIYYLWNMIIEQRKDNLISWVTGLNNESQFKLPHQIISLLDSSNSVDFSELTEHTNSRDLLKD